jgi:mannose PTS system EIID component
MIGPGTHLPRSVKLRVFLRSLLLQASWNPKGMQNLGLVYALYPALEVLYPDPEKRREAVQRHLTFFNTHPYVAAAIVGGVLYHEERIAAGEEDPRRVTEFKGALMGPLAALGDGFFWLSLRPAAGALCAALVPWLGAWAAVLFLVLYNVVHFTLRGRLFRMGLQLGDRLVEAVAKARLPTRGARLRAVAAASAGAAAALVGGSSPVVVWPWGRSVTFWWPGRFPPPCSPPWRHSWPDAWVPGCRMFGER